MSEHVCLVFVYQHIHYIFQYTLASCGMSDEDLSKLQQILDGCPTVPGICLDVANGYSEHFVEFVKTVRSKFPDHIIIVCIDNDDLTSHYQYIYSY